MEVRTYTGSMAHSRYAHTLTLMQSGKVLVAGDYSNSYWKDAELYDGPMITSQRSVEQMPWFGGECL